ncbi:MAG: hypothetical protein ACYC0X_02525 [Pirellulaceae bacterium]
MSPVLLQCRAVGLRLDAPQTASSLGSGLSALALVAVIALTSGNVGADSSEVRFDTMDLVACRDVAADSPALAEPQQRLIEARFQVTALPGRGELASDMQYVYEFLSPAGNLQIVDHQPRTTQSTSLAGPVAIEQTKEANKSLGASLSGGFQPFAQGTADADMGHKTLSHIRYELKPPMEVTLVAGTLQRGTGVHFRLLPAAELASEGSREFVMVMRVPRLWRADLMYLQCEAQQEYHDRVVSRGLSRFVIGLYAAGDEQARAAVETLNLAEASLRRTAAQRQRDIARRAIPSVVHKLGSLLDMYDPRIPDTWLDRLIYGPTNLQQYAFVDYLPEDVRRRADQYAQAKRRLSDYSGKRVALNPISLSRDIR